jgi:hypothetical protein
MHASQWHGPTTHNATDIDNTQNTSATPPMKMKKWVSKKKSVLNSEISFFYFERPGFHM